MNTYVYVYVIISVLLTIIALTRHYSKLPRLLELQQLIQINHSVFAVSMVVWWTWFK